MPGGDGPDVFGPKQRTLDNSAAIAFFQFLREKKPQSLRLKKKLRKEVKPQAESDEELKTFKKHRIISFYVCTVLPFLESFYHF